MANCISRLRNVNKAIWKAECSVKTPVANASKPENERLESHLNGFLNYVIISSFQSNSEVKFIQIIQFHKNESFSFPRTVTTVLHSKHNK